MKRQVDAVELPLLRMSSVGGYQSVVVTQDYANLSEESSSPLNNTSDRDSSLKTKTSSPSVWMLLAFSSVVIVNVLVHSAIIQPKNGNEKNVPTNLEVVSLLDRRLENWDAWKDRLHTSEESFLDWFHNETTWIKNKTRQNLVNPQVDMDEVLYFNSSLAYEMLHNEKETINTDFFRVSSMGWDAQINQAYCAVASSVAILNSFRGSAYLPMDSVYHPYHYATQHDVWNECTEKHVIHNSGGRDGVLHAPGGLGMAQTKALLECNLPLEWIVEAYYVDPSRTSQEDMERDIQSALSSADARVMVNYHRARVHQVGGGHWSPLVGYSYERNAFLILDVAKYKYPPAWIPSKLLYQSLSTTDSCGVWDFPDGNQDEPKTQDDFAATMKKLNCQSAYRGYVIVNKPRLHREKDISD